MAYLKQLARFAYDPVGAAIALRASRPVGVAFFTALGATVVFVLVMAGFPRDVMQMVQLESRDAGALAVLIQHLRTSTRALIPILFLVGIFIPTTLILLGALIPRESAREVLRREFGATVATSLSAWAAVFSLTALVAFLFADPMRVRGISTWTLSPVLAFFALYVTGLRPIAGAGWWRAIVAALLATPSLMLLPLAAWASYLAMSPFILVILFFIFRGVWRDWSSTRDAKLRFEQNLKAATQNPADGEAHLNLGVIREERGETEAAVEHFRKAIEINPREADAYFRLGCIARREKRLAEAIEHFNNVVSIDENHSQFEIWREVGATYFDAGQFEDARTAFERYVDRRSTDAEGLYFLGLTLARLNLVDEARDQMRTVVETVNNAPAFKFRREQRWLHQAEDYLKQK